MKKFLVYLLCLLAFSLFWSCKNDGEKVEPEVPFSPLNLFEVMAGGNQLRGVTRIIASSIYPEDQNKIWPAVSYHLTGEYFADRYTIMPRVYAGRMYLNGIEIPVNSSPDTIYGDLTSNSEMPDTLSPVFGTQAIFHVEGNPSWSIPPHTDTVYVPEQIELTSNIQGEIPKDSVIRFFWNKDLNNPGKTYVFMYYEGPASNREDSNLPATSWVKSVEIEDTGSYVFELNGWLKDIPSGGYFRVGVARGNVSTIGAEGYEYAFVGASWALNGYWRMYN